MLTKSAFQDEAENAASEKKPVVKHSVWRCPGCGRTVHESRQYCDCHTPQAGAPFRLEEKEPEVGPCNFETPGLNCGDCPETCRRCASFGELTTNRHGFGGKDCQHYEVKARCYCCRAQIKVGLDIHKENAFKIMGGITVEGMKAMGDLIREEMEKPVLARIRHAQGKAG